MLSTSFFVVSIPSGNWNHAVLLRHPQRLHRVHSHFFMVALGVTEGGFLLPELLPALAVDGRQHIKIEPALEKSSAGLYVQAEKF